MYIKGGLVQIIAKNDWYGLIGIIDYIDEDYMSILCIDKPYTTYIVTKDNEKDICEFVLDKIKQVWYTKYS